MESELSQLRCNADNLAQCLHALLRRIEQLEDAPLTVVEPRSDLQVTRSDEISVDPETQIKKRTVVTERVLTTKTFHAIAPVPVPDQAVKNGHHQHHRLLATAYDCRLTSVDAKTFNEHVEVEQCGGQLVVRRVAIHSPLATSIRSGDQILEVNGEPLSSLVELRALVGHLQLKLLPSRLHEAPAQSAFYRVLEDYRSEEDGRQPRPSLGLSLRKGDMIQVMGRDHLWLEARRVNDLSRVGLVPVDVVIEKVAMLTPYGRRVLVLLGVAGVGRRTLKAMLLAHDPDHFASVTPQTSRAPKPSEQEGREYQFCTKEEMLERIRDGQMIEWGELDGHLYGTSTESVRRVVRSGRVCVLDCAPQALANLYNREFMPFVVLLSPPGLEELRQLNEMNKERGRSPMQLEQCCAQTEHMLNGTQARLLDLVLINRNSEVTFRRLLDALDTLKTETQWVPDSWLD